MRWKWSQAMSPVSPFQTAPGVWLKVSQIDGPRPSAWTAPSIWYEAVAVPQRKPGGKGRGGPSLRGVGGAHGAKISW